MLRQYNMMQEKFLSKGITIADKLIKLQWQRSQMSNQYKPPFLPNKLTLFKAEKIMPLFQQVNSPCNHWESYSSHPIDVCQVPGDHETMFEEANAKVLAALINDKIEEIA